MTILRIDASAKTSGSVTRGLLDEIETEVGRADVRRDVGHETLPIIDGTWVDSNFTASDNRSEEQKATLALSDTLIGEIETADTLLIALPIYNFNVPGALKAWIDLVCRAGVTFKYTDTGPVGLLENKRAIVAVASGGTKVGSEMDHATPYMRFILGFIGITDVTFIVADEQNMKDEDKLDEARGQIAKLAA